MQGAWTLQVLQALVKQTICQTVYQVRVVIVSLYPIHITESMYILYTCDVYAAGIIAAIAIPILCVAVSILVIAAALLVVIAIGYAKDKNGKSVHF